MFDDHIASDVLARIAHKVLQQAKFLGCQLDDPVRAMHGPLHVIQFEVCHFQKRQSGPVLSAEHSANSRGELREREGFRKVIIRASVKASHPFSYFVSRRENQDGNIPVSASHLLKYFTARY